MKEGQLPSLVMSFSPYLRVFKLVMVTDSVRQTFYTKLYFIGQGTAKWIPPSPVAPNVSHHKKLGRSQALTWASFPGNNSFPTSFFVLPISQRSSECHGPPLPPTAPSTATYFSLHMLMLQSHSFSWWLCNRGRERVVCIKGQLYAFH